MKQHWTFLFAICLILFQDRLTTQADDWPQWRGPHRDGVWRETGIIKRFPQPRLEPRWRVTIGAGYSGPTVADGRVYITDRLDEPTQTERVLCLDRKSGTLIWSHSYDCPYVNVSYTAGPRAAVTINDGKAYSLGTMGNLICFDAARGTIQWQRDLNSEYEIRMPIWGIAAAPLVVDQLLILQIGGSNGACVVAINKQTGEEIWRSLQDQASYSSPILIQQAGREVVICYTGDNVAGLEPQSGEVRWRYPFPPTRLVIGAATPIWNNNRLFLTNFYDGSLMLQLNSQSLDADELWKFCGPDEKQTEALHSIISTPLFIGDYIYGVDSYGELRCLDARTGKRIWEDRTATPRARWSNIHFVKHEEQVWMFNERGELIISELSPQGFHEISRAHLIDPTLIQLGQRDGVCWSHPAFAQRHVFARNDQELICVSLEKHN